MWLHQYFCWHFHEWSKHVGSVCCSKIEFISQLWELRCLAWDFIRRGSPRRHQLVPASNSSFLPSSRALLPVLFLSVTLKLSEAGERTNCTHCHSNPVLMMATSVTWRFDWRVSGRRMGCEATAQLTSQFCPLICFPLTSPSTYSSASALFLFSGSQ